MTTGYEPKHEAARREAVRDEAQRRDEAADETLRHDNMREDVRRDDVRRDGDRDGRQHDNLRHDRGLDGSHRRDGVPGPVTDRPDHPDRQVEADDRPTVSHRVPAEALGLDHRSVVAREREHFGGVKFGSAFFGWLAATGMAALLTALVGGLGVAIGLGTDTTAGEVADQAANNPGTIGLAGAIALLVILFVSYYCGGYVAGRMARFSGAKQGLAVWLWALLAAAVVAVLAATAGDKYDILARLNGFPRFPINEGELPLAAIVTALALAGASLAGALLGGLAGMRFHRRVDRVGLQPVREHEQVG